MSVAATAQSTVQSTSRQGLPTLAVAALGVIYGDIGTSPLYAIKECFSGKHGVAVNPANILGIMSLVFWSLMIVISLKYVVFLLQADNKGEGGTFSLLATLRGTRGDSPAKWAMLTLLAAIGAALLYGDGVITPAISVLSAIEGLNVATDAASGYVVPLTCLVLIVLFIAQRHGTAQIGRIFGPVMMLWFATIGILGLAAIAKRPDILAAINPIYAIDFFAVNHFHGIIALGSVVLCITGGEALYADMGHFGPTPIRLSWYGIVLPGLLLNYFGQAAILLAQGDLVRANPFYALAPPALLYPLVALSTVATIVASQAMISGVYSLTQQAIQLGFSPRMRIIHTSDQAKGQIYLPTINWLLMAACLTLVLVFRESSNLAAAYGIAVTATMAITSFLYFQVTRHKWAWPLWQSAGLLILFLLFDCSFLGANLLKIADGGWMTLAIAAAIATCMITWRDGRAILAKHYSTMRMPTKVFLASLAELDLLRIAGTGIYMSISPDGIPHTLINLLKHNEALHQRILLLSVVSTETPLVEPEDRLRITDLGLGFYRVEARYGFMETPDVGRVVELLTARKLIDDIHNASFILGRETLLATGTNTMAQWRKYLFILMSRNAWNATSFFGLPPERVIEIGIQLEL